ncbi:hypothetical protein ACIOZL_30960 [Streptomyces sp. NPDC087769]|uniref:hypothetical protein n=1 Tax=Streptomyces sp. NPDC087769 TaxID=3365802 RepID=UPI00382076F2
MGWHGYLVLWCGVFGAWALVGYGRSLAGMTRAQRTVRATGRIERVDEPRHGSSPSDGIAVVVSFQDPATGQEFTVTNEGERGERISVARTGRETGVHYPRGRPHAFRFANDLSEGGRGLGWPTFAVFLVYAGLVAVAAIDRGWPWALLGFCGPWALSGLYHLPGNVRDRNRRIDVPAAMAASGLNTIQAAPGSRRGWPSRTGCVGLGMSQNRTTPVSLASSWPVAASARPSGLNATLVDVGGESVQDGAYRLVRAFEPGVCSGLRWD